MGESLKKEGNEMKKLWALCLALGLLALIPSAQAEDWDEDWDGDWDAPGYVEGDTLILPEGITALGCYMREWVYNPETGDWDVIEHPEEEAWFEDAYRFLGGYFGEQEFSDVQWPSTMKYLGGESFVGYHFPELTLPASLEKIYPYAFNGWIDVLRIETTLPWEQIGELRWDGNGMDNVIGAYEAPEDHPLYKTVDGVLFTKDGTTLLSYPNGRTAAHYDVPRGVEHIADRAFANNGHLQTVSLPIGLKTVGDYGFSGCTRLQSIALPLTVTEIGKEIFDNCVSLELVSLPEGLQADKPLDDWWAVYYRDEDRYRGDNGDTLPSPDAGLESMYTDGDAIYLRESVRLVGSGTKVFAEPWDEENPDGEDSAVRLLLDVGGVYGITVSLDEKALLTDPITRDEIGWVNVKNVEYLPCETLFAWAEIEPRSAMPVWQGYMPVPGKDEAPQETEISREDGYVMWYGPFLIFREWSTGDSYVCRIQDAELTREPDGTDSVYGIVYSQDAFADVPLRSGPGGEVTEYLIGGTQIRILDPNENGCFVTTGIVNGWVNGENIRIIPEKQEGN